MAGSQRLQVHLKSTCPADRSPSVSWPAARKSLPRAARGDPPSPRSRQRATAREAGFERGLDDSLEPSDRRKVGVGVQRVPNPGRPEERDGARNIGAHRQRLGDR
jgi:hypothetical protein